MLVNPGNIPQTATEKRTVQDAARVLGARVVILNASSPSEIESVFATLVGERAGALVVSGETFFLTQRHRLVELAARHAVPTIYAYRDFPAAGGLMSYGGNFADSYRLIGVYAGRILKGEKPADLAVQRSTKVELEHNPIGLNQYRKGRDSQTRSDRRVLPDRMIRGTSDAEGLFPGLA